MAKWLRVTKYMGVIIRWRKSKLKKQAPLWMNKAIRKSLREKDKLLKIYKNDSTEINKEKYYSMPAKVKK